MSYLYEGTFVDILECLPSSHKRIRHDPFLEIPIPIGTFYSILRSNFIIDVINILVFESHIDGIILMIDSFKGMQVA